jgi:TRAP-type mannitol/chloroaromatic compound transport system substrate-binding protein
VLRRAAQIANKECQTKYDAANPAALKRLVAAGTQFRPFPQDVMEASWKASNEVTAEVAAKNAKFKKMNDAYQGFRNDQYLWWQVAEYSFDNFMIRQRAK